MMTNIIIGLFVRKSKFPAKFIHKGDDIFKYVANLIFHTQNRYISYLDKDIINLWIIQELSFIKLIIKDMNGESYER